MSEGSRIELRHLPERMFQTETMRVSNPSAIPIDFTPGIDTMQTVEKRMIQEALARAGQIKTEAARLLGISRFQLLRRMERHGLIANDSSDEKE